MHSVGKAHLSPAFISQVDGLSVKLLVTNELSQWNGKEACKQLVAVEGKRDRGLRQSLSDGGQEVVFVWRQNAAD